MRAFDLHSKYLICFRICRETKMFRKTSCLQQTERHCKKVLCNQNLHGSKMVQIVRPSVKGTAAWDLLDKYFVDKLAEPAKLILRLDDFGFFRIRKGKFIHPRCRRHRWYGISVDGDIAKSDSADFCFPFVSYSTDISTDSANADLSLYPTRTVLHQRCFWHRWWTHFSTIFQNIKT